MKRQRVRFSTASRFSSSLQASIAACQEAVRRKDSSAFVTALLLPERRRRAVLAVRAFNLELASLRDAVYGNETTGVLRCQWWREFVRKACSMERDSHIQFQDSSSFAQERHPVFPAFRSAVQEFGLTRRWFDRMIDAREDDIVRNEIRTLRILEAYAEDTASSLMYLQLEILGVENSLADHAASHAGKAIGLSTALFGFPFLLEAGQNRIPSDVMQKHKLRERAMRNLVMESSRMKEQDFQDSQRKEELASAFSALTDCTYEVASTAHGHLEHCRGMQKDIPRAAFPAFLNTVSSRIFLDRLEKVAHFDILDPRLRHDPFMRLRLQYEVLKSHFFKKF